MKSIYINGGKKLSGEVAISGAKNAALPILAAGLLCGGKHRIANVPQPGRCHHVRQDPPEHGDRPSNGRAMIS